MKLVLVGGETPYYQQIYTQLVRQIADGTLKADECLPSIRSVARELGIGIITVKSAYEALEQNGFIYTAPGRGCFVKKRRAEEYADKKLLLAREKMLGSVTDCRALGVSKEEMLTLAARIFDEQETAQARTDKEVGNPPDGKISQ